MDKFVTITTNSDSSNMMSQKQLSKIHKLEQDLKHLQKRINSPKVDLVQINNIYRIRIELPGVERESIKIQIKENQIILITYNKMRMNK